MYFVFDTETSGLPKARMPNFRDADAYSTCRIVSIAWTVLDTDFKVKSKGYFLVKPLDFVIPESATAIHGITNEQALNSGYVFRDVLKTIRNDLIECNELVAHNLSFDFGVLLHECHRLKDEHMINLLFKMERKCTMLIGKKQLALKKMPRLGELYAALYPGKVLEGAHNAVVDTDCCVDCFCALNGFNSPSVIIEHDSNDSNDGANDSNDSNDSNDGANDLNKINLDHSQDVTAHADAITSEQTICVH